MTFGKFFRWCLFLLWFMVVIFLSAQTGSESGGFSHWIADKIFSNPSPEFHAFIRNCAHFGIHFILAIVMYAAFYSYDEPRTYVTYLGLVIAVFDELIQFYSPGRCFEFIDIVLNVSGIITGVLLAALIVPKKNRPHY